MIGVQEEHFWDSTPSELYPYRKAHELREEQLDIQMWQMGMYVNRAVAVAVSGALMGSKSKAKYFELPFSQMDTDPVKTKQDDFLKFSAWAAMYNETHFKKKDEGAG